MANGSNALTPQIARLQREYSNSNVYGGPNGGVRTTNNIYDPNLYNVSFTPSQRNNANTYSPDYDVRAAQNYLNQYNYGNDKGNNITRLEPGIRKLYEQSANRVALKKSLAQTITDQPEMLKQELGLLQSDAEKAAGQGVKRTRENYNSRGLLYSGAREGGELGVRGQVANQLARASGAARSESENLTNKYKEAFASIGLADQEKKNQMAEEAFKNSYQNSIARQQALQQLAGGAGQAIGYYYGSRAGANSSNPQNGGNTNYTNPSWSVGAGGNFSLNPNSSYYREGE